MLEERVLPVSVDRLFSVKTLLVVTDFVAFPLLDVAFKFVVLLLDEFTDESFVLPVLALLLLVLPFSTTPEPLLLDSLELRYAFVPVVRLP